MNATSIAQTGLSAAQTRMNASAHNLANVQTDKFRRQEVTQQATEPGGTTVQVRRAPVEGEAMNKDLVEQKSAGYAFDANLKVIQTEKKMMGRLLDEKA